MSAPASVIIVGASAAGIACLRALRANGYEGAITLVDRDAYGAYERPPLSKQVLIEPTTKAEDVALIKPEKFAELNIECVFGRAVASVSAAEKKVILEDGEELSAETIVLAVGGEARRLPLPGCDLPGVYVLRHFNDAQALREKITGDAKVAVVGGGFIGAETAASLAKLGKKVFWLDVAELPLAHLLPKDLSEKIVEHHIANGVELIPSVQIEKISAGDNGELTIHCKGIDDVVVNAVVLGVGMAPNTQLVNAAEIKLNDKVRGIEVDENQQTSAEGIYAAGDVAAIRVDEANVVRHEHWQSAQYQGEKVAAVLTGSAIPQEPVDWFWSDQGDLHIEMAGHATADSEMVIREEGDWPVYFFLRENTVVSAVSVNNPNAVRVALRLIKGGNQLTAEKLKDTNIQLRQLMRG